MKIAIIGAGVSGAFLARMLNNHQVEVFESYAKEEHFPVCAWGASRNMLDYYSKLAGLNFDDYILHIGKKVEMRLPNGNKEFLNCLGLVTYHKQQWEHDLLDGIKVNYGVRCTLDTFPIHKYDYVLDCTGFHRSMLPKVENELIVPAYEYMVENVKHDEFYILGYKNATGYFWYFPLNNNRAFIGAGDIHRRYYGIKEFFEENKNVKVLNKIGRPIRITPPTRMEPFYYKNIIGVGESIGCVFPLLGEGIIPSLISAELLLNSMNDKIDLAYYRDSILKRFKYYDDVYKLIRLMIAGKFSKLRHWPIIYSMYKNMKREEKRFGFEVNINKLKNMLNALQGT